MSWFEFEQDGKRGVAEYPDGVTVTTPGGRLYTTDAERTEGRPWVCVSKLEGAPSDELVRL